MTRKVIPAGFTIVAIVVTAMLAKEWFGDTDGWKRAVFWMVGALYGSAVTRLLSDTKGGAS